MKIRDFILDFFPCMSTNWKNFIDMYRTGHLQWSRLVFIGILKIKVPHYEDAHADDTSTPNLPFASDMVIFVLIFVFECRAYNIIWKKIFNVYGGEGHCKSNEHKCKQKRSKIRFVKSTRIGNCGEVNLFWMKVACLLGGGGGMMKRLVEVDFKKPEFHAAARITQRDMI